MKRWKIEPLDTLFFQGGQPFNAGESGYIESLFPPSPETAQGLIRTSILYRHARNLTGYMNGTDGSATINGVDLDLFSEIGRPESGVGKLRLQGPFPMKQGELLFPVPLDVVRTSQGHLLFLQPTKDPRLCDLGSVRLPIADGVGLKVLEGAWVTARQMKQLLEGTLPSEAIIHEKLSEGFLRKTIFHSKQREAETLFVAEPRVGIARNNATRTAKEGHLYVVSLLRLREGVEFAVWGGWH